MTMLAGSLFTLIKSGRLLSYRTDLVKFINNPPKVF